MPYSPIGADENGNLPPVVRAKLEQTYAPIGSVGGGSGLTDDGTGLFTISSGSSITEDPSNAGLYLIGA